MMAGILIRLYLFPYLSDICKRIMIERSLQLSDVNGAGAGNVGNNGLRCAIRPTNLPTENHRWVQHRENAEQHC